MNLGHTCLFHKGIFTVSFGNKEKMRLLLHIVHSGNMIFWGKQKLSKTNKLAPRKKIDLELLHQRLGHRSIRPLMSGDAANVSKDIEPRIYPYHFCTSCQISSINKKARYKKH